MPGFQTQCQVLLPAGYAERDCLLVQYSLPGLPHCFVLCHEPMTAPDLQGRADLMAFFMAQASRLALESVGDDQAFVLVHNGATMRKRANYAQPIAHAVAWAMMPWLLAIACLLRATRHAVVLAPVEPVAK
ncbi:MAG: hypothetical protein ABIR54_03580 [Burkholderiaceae bacterium]|jgi:hypothetical protein